MVYYERLGTKLKKVKKDSDNYGIGRGMGDQRAQHAILTLLETRSDLGKSATLDEIEEFVEEVRKLSHAKDLFFDIMTGAVVADWDNEKKQIVVRVPV